MSRPVVKARADTSRFKRAARSSVCTRTSASEPPKAVSIRSRTSGSRVDPPLRAASISALTPPESGPPSLPTTARSGRRTPGPLLRRCTRRAAESGQRRLATSSACRSAVSSAAPTNSEEIEQRGRHLGLRPSAAPPHRPSLPRRVLRTSHDDLPKACGSAAPEPSRQLHLTRTGQRKSSLGRASVVRETRVTYARYP